MSMARIRMIIGMAIKTHYDNLKVARNAPDEVIRAAYKVLSQKYHPDRNCNTAESHRVFKIVNESYRVLSDPIKRDQHNRWIIKQEANRKLSCELDRERPKKGSRLLRLVHYISSAR